MCFLIQAVGWVVEDGSDDQTLSGDAGNDTLVAWERLASEKGSISKFVRGVGLVHQATRLARNQVVALPIRIPDSDGAPARVIAMQEEG